MNKMVFKQMLAMAKMRSKSSRAKRFKSARKMTKVAIIRKSRVRAPKVPRMHMFSRMTNNFQITLPAGSSYSNGSIIFQLDNLINHTEFTALFDQYKILKVEISFKLHTNPYMIYATQYTPGTLAAAPVTFPVLWLTNDDDDSTALSRAEFQERPRSVRRVLQPNKILKWTVRPKILAQTYRTAATTGYAPKYGQFIDCSQPNVPHYCTKWGIDYDGYTLPATAAGPYGQDLQVGVEMRYFFVMRDVR